MKKGFTLVELLAVIVILAVILVIAVPQINSVIKQTKKNSLASTAKLIAAKAEEATVENEILESNEALTCANLVKLDDNYGNCTVSIVNGKGTVTIVGAGKFAGIRCTGTKDNMTCTEGNTPEYVYSFTLPYYDYTYTVTDFNTCKSYVKQLHLNGYYSDQDAETYATSICNGSNNVYGYANYNIDNWIHDSIQNMSFTYQDISSFVERSSDTELFGIIDDYTAVTYPYSNTPAAIFMRWPGSNTSFTKNDNPSVCTTYGGNLNCFEYNSRNYSDDSTRLQELFGTSNCTISTYTSNNEEINQTYCSANSMTCSIRSDGYVECNTSNIGCSVTGYDAGCGMD